MSEKDRTRFVIPEKPKHPLGWACENCQHVLKQVTSARTDMVCRAHPPFAQLVTQGVVSIYPPVSEGEWCGEFYPSNDNAPPDTRTSGRG